MDETEADGAGVGESNPGESSSASGGGESTRDTPSNAQNDSEPSRDASGGGGSGGDVFDQLAAARERRLQAQADELSLIVDACAQHRVNETTANRGVERLVAGGADGTPLVGEFLAHELALVLRITPTTAALRMVSALNLKHRHPRLWTAVQQLELETWQATRVAVECASAGLKAKAARWVDDQLATATLLLPWPRALRHLASLIIKADPATAAARAEQAQQAHEVLLGEIRDGSTTLFARLAARDGLFLDGMLNRVADILTCQGEQGSRQQLRARALGILATPGYATQLLASTPDQDLLTDQRPAVLDLTGIDPDRLLPKTTLYVHIADDTLRAGAGAGAGVGAGVGRVEQVGAVTVDQVRQFLGHSRVRVVPVLDHDHLPAVDAYEIPDRLREAILLRHTVEAFPWSNRAARGCEQDHTIPYDPQAPPGSQQTRANNLGPFGKRSHRAKTHTGWQVTQLLDGVFHWRSPHGYHALVTPDGTIPLGRERARTPAAQAAA